MVAKFITPSPDNSQKQTSKLTENSQSRPVDCKNTKEFNYDNCDSYKGDQPSKDTGKQLITLNLGYDTEYVTFTESLENSDHILEYADCTTVQLAIAGELDDFHHEDLIKQKLDHGITGLAFKPPESRLLGNQFLLWLESILTAVILAKGLTLQDKVKINLWAFYNNAELSLIIPNREYIKNYAVERKNKDLPNSRLVPIQGSGIFSNVGLSLPSNISIDFRDARLLSGGGSLRKLGDSLGFQKGDIDFEKYDANWYFENELNKFLDYGIRDAMIPLKWVELFHQQVESVCENLANNFVIGEKDCIRLSSKTYTTVASVTENLMKASLVEQGKYKQHQELVQYLINEVVPQKFTNLNKGGLNKSSHGFAPEIIKNIDMYDIKSAYLTAIRYLRFPIVKPSIQKIYGDGSGEVMTLKELAQRLDKYPVAFVIVDEIFLGDNIPENKRILNMYDNEGECCTVLENSGISQIFTGLEIQAQATVLESINKVKNSKVKVRMLIGWSRKICNSVDRTISYYELFTQLKDLRVEDKEKYGNKSPQQEVDKLLGNGGCGKLAQNKEGYDSDFLMDCLTQGGLPNNSIKDSFNSKVYNPFFFNLITATVRTVTGLSYALSNGFMAVTDSVVCPTDNFIDSKTIASNLRKNQYTSTRYKTLEKLLNYFDWEKEQKNCYIQLIRERNYLILNGKEKVLDNYARKLKMGKATKEDLEGIEITKAARGGYHQKGDKNSRENLVELALFGNSWFNGKPIKQVNKKLTKMNDMLVGERNLNQSYLNGQKSAGLGSHSHKYNCNSLHEFRKRKLLKQMCRLNGYADAFHCQVENPEKFEELNKRVNCRINGNYKNIISGEDRRLLGILQYLGHYSCRALEKVTGISRSTLNRFKKDIERSLIHGRIFNDIARKIGNTKADLVRALDDFIERNRLKLHLARPPLI